MKDYLQLEGLAYKLIPIKTPNNNSIELGRIDTELMYQKVMDWEWGNSGSPEIYHDPETRKHFGVIVRSTVGRLTEQLIQEGKIDKARNIVELIDREADLLNRGRSEKSLAGLRKRLSNMFLRFIETPEFNPEAARFQKVPRDLMLRPDVRPITSGPGH